MSEPLWLTRQAIEIIHREQIAEHGGLFGIRNEDGLESALARPINKHGYGSEDLCELAAAYLFGIVRNHPFVDGNKRAGFLAAFVFLYTNGLLIEAGEAEIVAFVLAVASGEIE